LVHSSRKMVSILLVQYYCLGAQIREDGLYTVRTVLPWYIVPGRWSL
jgi:hypothetical protein